MTALIASVQTAEDLQPYDLGTFLVMLAAAVILTALALHVTRRLSPDRDDDIEPTVPRQLTHANSHRQENR